MTNFIPTFKKLTQRSRILFLRLSVHNPPGILFIDSDKIQQTRIGAKASGASHAPTPSSARYFRQTREPIFVSSGTTLPFKKDYFSTIECINHPATDRRIDEKLVIDLCNLIAVSDEYLLGNARFSYIFFEMSPTRGFFYFECAIFPS